MIFVCLSLMIQSISIIHTAKFLSHFFSNGTRKESTGSKKCLLLGVGVLWWCSVTGVGGKSGVRLLLSTRPL